jgi:EAL domain-containing protein (putative c-di-GMP-specific phosphodiesterase class I)
LDLVLDDLARYPDIVLAVNISGLTATDRSWLRALNVHLKDRPDMASRLIIEITETVALRDIEETARFVSAVRDLGCRVAVDDFGAGYTTFSHIKALTADLVKIDGSFVMGISGSEESRLFVRNLLNLARSFGLSTVAECVETAEDAECLAREGVELLQGHYFGRPTTNPAWKTASPDSKAAKRVAAREPRQAAG